MRAQTQLIPILKHASTLAERLSEDFVPAVSAAADPRAATRFAAWTDLVTGGDVDRFGKRLAWDGLLPDQVRAVLGEVRWRSGRPMPEWAELLAELFDELDAADEATETDRVLDLEQPIPFQELLVPLVRVARKRLAGWVDLPASLVSEGAMRDLERGLLKHLADLCGQTFYVEFSVYRTHHGVRSLFGLGTGDAVYRMFVGEMLTGRLQYVLARYSVLARLAATRTLFWIRNTAAFLRRLNRDRTCLALTFASSADPGPVVAVRPDLSDSHRGGRRVNVFSFADGTSVVYKPRSMAVEAAYYSLVGWINERASGLRLKSLRVVERRSYGWMEFATAAECPSDEAVERYYTRAGMVLCINYVLGGSDFHDENIIACGEHPVLVDLEILISPDEKRLDGQPIPPGARARRNSVLRTMLLPFRILERDGAMSLQGGLADKDARLPVARLRWLNVNRDAMTLRTESTAEEGSTNRPRLRGREVSVDEHAAALQRGFTSAYQLLLERRNALLCADGPLAMFRRKPVRTLLRSTGTYARLLRRTLNPRFLQDGVDRSIELEALARTLVTNAGCERCLDAYRAEHRALELHDVPLFRLSTEDTTLRATSGERVWRFSERAGLSAVRHRLRRLSKRDLIRQTHFIRLALAANKVCTEREKQSRGSHGATDALAAAVDIADELERLSFPRRDGTPDWVALLDSTTDRSAALGRVDDSLCFGRSGIALFHAALFGATRDERYRKLARSAVAPVLARVASEPGTSRLRRRLGIGGAGGLGGIAYALQLTGRLLESDEIRSTAFRAAAGITAEAIAADTKLDVYLGTAGAALALLALYEETGSEALLEQALRCGEHLLAARSVEPCSGRRAWRTQSGRHATGFAHGAGGIAFALARLYRHTGKEALREAALDAFAYEDSLFVPDHANWLDGHAERVPPPGGRMMSAWCHGAVGVGLARIASQQQMDTDVPIVHVLAAAEAAAAAPLRGSDHPCCGALGRAEFLHQTASSLGRGDLQEAAHRLVGEVIERGTRRTMYGTKNESAYAPGFFQGLSGIGYQLLHLRQPDTFPAVLLWNSM